jgi:hypothetical protein
MFSRMGAENLHVAPLPRFSPNNGQIVLLAQKLDRGEDAPGTFGMAGARIISASLVGDDFHLSGSRLTKMSQMGEQILFAME